MHGQPARPAELRRGILCSALLCSVVNTVAGKFYSREEDKIKAELQRVLEQLEAGGGGAGRGAAVAEERRGRESLESSRWAPTWSCWSGHRTSGRKCVKQKTKTKQSHAVGLVKMKAPGVVGKIQLVIR